MLVTGTAVAATYGSKICNNEGYHCYTAKRGDTWSKLFPNENDRISVMKINRVNIGLHKGMKIAVPDSLGSSFMDHAPFPTQDEATGNRYIKVSLSKLAFGAYDESGQLQYWGPISGGKGYCPDIRRGCHTPTGQFAIYNKGGAGCKSKKYPVGRGGAPMPYCMFFHGGFALHGSNDVPGYMASHGCVRMGKDDAKWLNQIFTNGYSHVSVIINQ
jgi:lipoprotein-anchoring transpeptidase ErfK/SrfK